MFNMHINIRSSWNFATVFLYLKSNEMNGLDLAIIGGQLIPSSLDRYFSVSMALSFASKFKFSTLSKDKKNH